MAYELNDKIIESIIIDLIEPKFDPTHEVSRAMVEFNRFIQPYYEELEREFNSIEKIGTAIFNRKVWESENDKDYKYLQEDHYLFSNLSSKFDLKKGDKNLFYSIWHSLRDEKGDFHNAFYSGGGGSELQCDKCSAKGFLFKNIHRKDWVCFIKKLNRVYENLADYQKIDIDDFLTTSANKAKVVYEWCTKEDADKDCKSELTELLRDFTSLLRMPVLGLFPGTLTECYIADSEKYNKPLVYLTYLTGNGNEIEINCLSRGKEVDVYKRKQLDIFHPEADKSKIVDVMTKLTQLLVKGMPLDVSYTVFLSIPIFKSYYPGCKKISGTVGGFLMGWVFIPINLKKPEGTLPNEQRNVFIDDFMYALKENNSLTNLIEGCLIAGNMLVESVRSAGARRAVSQANVDDDDMTALSNSVHNMSGWKVIPGDDSDLEKAEYQRWSKVTEDVGTEKDIVIMRLGNRLENGSYEVDDSGKVIHLTKTDKSFVELLGRSQDVPNDAITDEDIYLHDLAQRLRTVHALIIDKSEIARVKSSREYQKSMHSVPEAISSSLGKLIDHARSCPGFDVPVQLYLLSVESAVRSGRLGDWERFEKYVPLPDGILKTLKDIGFNKKAIEDVLFITKPLAISRLGNRGILDVTPVVNISDGVLKPEYNQLDLGVVIAILVNMMKESIEHTEVLKIRSDCVSGITLETSVEIKEDAIVISNPTKENDESKYVKNSASRDVIGLLADYLKGRNSKWEVEGVKLEEGQWIQCIKYLKAAR